MSATKLAKYFELPNLKLQDTHRDFNSRFIHIHYQHVDEQACPYCESQETKTHQWRVRKVKDAPFRNKIPLLHIRHRRMFCKSCKRTFTETIPGIRRFGKVTERMQREILYACENFADHKKVRNYTTCGSKTIFKRCYQQLELKQRERQNNPWPNIIGIDEHAFIKNKQYGYREFVSIIVDYKNNRPKELVPGKSKAQLEASLGYIEGRSNVEYVCMDLSSHYRSFVQDFFPNAKIVADHFHVVKLLHPTINKMRKEITGDKRKHPLRKLLLKSGINLDVFQRKAIWRWLDMYPRLKAVYTAKEWIHKLYRCKGYDRAKGCFIDLTDWLAIQQIKELQVLRKTLLRWKNEILMFFKKRITNAKTEGFNNVAKSIIKKAYGFRNVGNYRLKVLNIRSNAAECSA